MNPWPSRLVLVERRKGRLSLYRCECGAVVERRRHDVDRGLVKSCGCLNREFARQRFTTHGDVPKRQPTAEYRAWKNMKLRCNSSPTRKEYADYVARGITVCERWASSFEAFLADMGRKPTPRHSLDRINNNGNYEPGNCRWATPQRQARNRRRTLSIEWQGEAMSLPDWAERLKVPYSRLFHRLRRGWSIEQAFTAEVTP